MSRRLWQRVEDVKIYRDSDTQEYVVVHDGGSEYFTPDKQDAVDTANLIIARRKGQYEENAGAKMRFPIHSYFSAQTAWHDAHRGRGSGKIGNNTWITDVGRGYAVVLHRTPIVTYRPDGSVELNSGGHRTVTTKARMNEVLPPGWRVTQSNYEWTVTTPAGQHEFFDRMVIQEDGQMDALSSGRHAFRGERRNPPGDALTGYLDSISRYGEELKDWRGKPLGWRYESTVTNWHDAQGNRVYAILLSKGSGRRRQYAGGLYLGDEGSLFRGRIFGILGFGGEREASEMAMTEAQYWMERDADDALSEGDDDE